jgi:hypothetical protein
MELPGCELFPGDALDAYGRWPAPAVIVSHGAYGVGGSAAIPAGRRA